MQIRACHPPSPGSHWASRGLEDKSPSPSLSLQTSSTSLLPTHPHKGLPVSSVAPSSSWLGALVPSPRSTLSQISPGCSSSLRLTADLPTVAALPRALLTRPGPSHPITVRTGPSGHTSVHRCFVFTCGLSSRPSPPPGGQPEKPGALPTVLPAEARAVPA